MVTNVGLINIDNSISNYNKKIRALEKSCELLLISLNIRKLYYIFALLSLSERKTLTYNFLYSEHNITRAKTALKYFIEDKDRFGKSTN